MPELEAHKPIAGVKINSNGTLDLSHAVYLVDDEAATSDSLPIKEVTAATEFPLPSGWTYLLHGTNLAKAQWQGESAAQLDSDVFEVKGRRGLSVVEKEDIERDLAVGYGSTTKGYSHGTGAPVEIRVLFPKFHSRRPLTQERRAELSSKYGEEFTNNLLALTDQVHWRNDQAGRHPLLPRGMKLIKLKDEQVTGQGRVIQYIPEVLQDFYKQELSQ